MNLKKLNGIAKNAVEVGTCCLQYPFGLINPPFEIQVDLLTGKLNPDMKGDDVEKFYKGVSAWFLSELQKEKIPIEIIVSAIIEIKQNIGIAYPNRSKLRGITAMQIDRVLTDAY